MNQIIEIIQKAVLRLFDVEQDVQLSRPDLQFGDFATNVAMQLSKQLGKNPREIAEKLVSELQSTGEFTEVSLAGPGFINLRLKDETLTKELKKIVNNPDDYGKPDLYKDKNVITEYSDPNPFKVLHVGHFYTSVIGDAISNLIENAGGQVHRVNFGGDVGLHVAKTMWAILREFGGENPDKLAEINEAERVEFMGSCYVTGTRAYEDDESAKTEITDLNKRIYQIHIEGDHESAFAQIYWQFRKWSYEYFDAFYTKIGTKFEKYYPESDIAQIGLNTVLEQNQSGVFKDSDGAIIFEGEPYGLHTRVFVNKSGLPTYEAKDVGLSIKKWEDYHFDQSVIITGNDIIEYMKVVLKAIEQFKPELSSRTRHITHGMVKLIGGVKMASRKGNFLRAIDVLSMVADANEAAQGNRDTAPILGAIKYAFLKFKIGADSSFDPKESVSIHGNSGPYLQYALARAKSVVRKSEIDSSEFESGDYSISERNLLFKLTEYKDVIQTATKDLTPHILCTYLYELAQVFNRFYENSQIIGDEREKIRIKLVEAYASILADGLKILGIPTPERM
jgi:arginyl-tRNA synthetase